MSIILKQSAGALVTPTDDALLYNIFLGNQVGIVKGIAVTHLGANRLKISAGWGVCQGRQFVVTEETINAAVAGSGNMKGRLLIHIDVVAEIPIRIETQVAATLPELVKEDINGSGTIYQIEIAKYSVTEITISNLVMTVNPLVSILGVANAAQAIANAAMPKGGGTFTGNVNAVNSNRSTSCLRNTEVRITSPTGALQATNSIIMVRK